MVEGVLLIHKPSGITSHDVVAAIRRLVGIRRVGHTGTLDPLAEGLLIVLVGQATKLQHAYQGHDKAYEAVIQLGRQTNTGDAEGHVIKSVPVPLLNAEVIRNALSVCQGTLMQQPPIFSAVKIRGRPSYWWARHQQPVTPSARIVQIFSLTLLAWEPTSLTVHVECSAGTYIRTLAETIAQRLGTVGHVRRLIRVRVGPWKLEEAGPFDRLLRAPTEELMSLLRPVAVAAPVS